MFRNLKIGVRLTLSFFLIAIISVSVIGFISYDKGKESLSVESFNRLTAVREMKATQIEDYFKEIRGQVISFSKDPTIVMAMREFKESFDNVDSDLNYSPDSLNAIKNNLVNYYNETYLPKLNQNLRIPANLEDELSKNTETIILQNLYISTNPNKVGEKLNLDFASDGSQYSKTHAKYHHFIRDFLEQFGYYDIFLIDDKTGRIVYTVYKEVDFGTSLTKGPFSFTNIARAYEASSESNNPDFVKIVDYEPYHPSYNAHAAFITSPIYDGPEKIGVLCFQMPIDKINNIMTNHERWADVGLGESGETYIVGEDYKLRNQSRFLIEDSTNYFKMIKKIGVPKETISRIRNLHITIGLQEVKTKGTIAALSGVTGSEIFADYRGVPVLSSYKPLNIQDMNWVIMSEIDEAEAFSPIYKLKTYIIIVFAVLMVLIIFTSWMMSRRMTKPLKHLTGGAKQLAKGNLNAVIEVKGKDEIGILAMSFRKMQISINNLIDELKDINQNLENKVKERTIQIEQQKDMLEEKNKEIIDSINYAKRIQNAILPTDKIVKEYLKESFVLYKPKDIVAGDFYWMETISSPQRENMVLFAAADCTGHGVPGAMVSVVCHNALNRTVREYGLTDPGEILTKTREIVVEEFEKSDEGVKDGMDIALCSLTDNTLQYAGAHNPLWVVRDCHKELIDVSGNSQMSTFQLTEEEGPCLIEIKANKQPIGKFDNPEPYTTHTFELEKGDVIYIFTDGYVDQFGGERGKKFKTKVFRELLLEIHKKTMSEQKKLIEKAFEKWKGNLEQVDDVCVIGVKI